MIPHNKPTIDDNDVQSVCNVLKSGWLAPGKKVEEFESGLSDYLSPGGHSLAVDSATAAIHFALIGLGIKKGDEVIIPTYLSIANMNMIKNMGAKPVLVDINAHDFNISFEDTKKNISGHTKAIIVPHMYGIPTDIKPFLDLGIPIIENCAVGLGAKYKNRKIGTFGDVSIFSFSATKLLTTAKGGAIFSKNTDLIEDLRELTDILKNSEYRIKFNYRMNDMQAALGISQLKKVDEFIRIRKKIAYEYNTIIDNKINAKRIEIPSNMDGVWYRYIIISEMDPDKVNIQFRDNGVATINPLENWELLHNRVKLKRDRFPNAEKITGKTVSVPIFPSLDYDEIHTIKSIIDKIY